MIHPRQLRQLEAVDWDFPADQEGVSSALHWYPGTFPAQLPATLIQALSSPSDLILDPFGGIGTTSSEATRLARRVLLVDSNPVAVLSSYVNCGLLLLLSKNPNWFEQLFRAIDELLAAEGDKPPLNLSLLRTSHDPMRVDEFVSAVLRPAPRDLYSSLRKGPPQLLHLRKWFGHRTLAELLRIDEAASEGSLGEFGRLLVLTMISSSLRSASSQTSSWGHIADNVWPKALQEKSVSRLLSNWLARAKNRVLKVDLSAATSHRGEIRGWFATHDWGAAGTPRPKPRDQPRLLLTSPPYGDAIDYTRAQRLTLYFLGYCDADILSACTAEIGARRKRFAADSLQKWANDLGGAFGRQLDLLPDDGLVALVLPHKDPGREVGILTLKNVLEGRDWALRFSRARSIRQSKTRQSWTSIKMEVVVVYSKT